MVLGGRPPQLYGADRKMGFREPIERDAANAGKSKVHTEYLIGLEVQLGNNERPQAFPPYHDT